MFSPESWFLFNVTRSLIEPKDWLSFKFIDYLCFLPPFGLDCLWIYSNKEKSTMILNVISTLETSLIFIILSEIFISYSTFIRFSGDFFVCCCYKAMLNFHYMQIYVDVSGAFFCFKSHWESADCLLPLSFFHLSINLLLVVFFFFSFLPSVCLCIQRRVF